jgi:hypothetical protein
MREWQRRGGPWDDRAFAWVVFLCPLFLLLDWWVVRGIGMVALAAVLVRGWPTVRRDPGMLAFLCFIGLITAIEQNGGRALRELTVPYTGWVATGPYFCCIFFVVVALWSGSSPFRRGVLALLTLQVFFGVVEWFLIWPHVSENPYLRVEVWRPVWTVAIPLFWIAILLVGERNRQRGEVEGSNMASGPPNNQMQLTSGAAQAVDAARS